MTRRAIIGVPIQIPLVLACLCRPADAPADRRLWVLQEPDQIVEYDPMTFAIRRSLQVPRQAGQEPMNFFVSRTSQMLFVAGPAEGEADESRKSAANRIWLWDGRAAALLNRGILSRTTRTGDSFSIVEILPRCFLAADGRHLYWAANEFHKLREKESGPDLSVTTTFRVWRTDLQGSRPVPLAVFAFAPCPCATGVCSETCPEVDPWVPNRGVSDFFLATHWVPGQLGASYQTGFHYRESAGKWLAARLPQALEKVLDAAPSGTILLYAALDGGCCGWDNEGNDQTLMMKNGKSTVLFDERKRFANPNYDVSFFTSNAFLSPDTRFAAMTVVSSAGRAGEIRLSSGGKPDTRELERVRQAIDDLPAVEVLRLGDPAVLHFKIPHATLAGWLNDQEIVVAQDGVLVVFNIARGTRRQSQIKVPSASWIYPR